jgi:hypothetical protein
MSDQKISELTALTGANVADTDLLPIVDTSATETKKITFGEFKTALDTATGFVRITGDTMTGNLSFGDNNKAIFGAGSDLQIYHDGTNSYIRDNAEGVLRIQGAANVQIEGANEENMAVFNQDEGVFLYYDGATKLSTTATGIEVNGTVTADNGSSTVDLTGNSLVFDRNSANYIRTSDAAGYLRLQTGSGDTAFFSANGDISFYEDTGTTAKFFWDASAEKLLIGDTSNSTASGLYIKTADPTDLVTGQLVLKGTALTGAADTGASIVFEGFNGSGNRTLGSIQSLKENSTVGDSLAYMRFSTFGSSGTQERMRIDSSGNVGIGTSSPAANAKLHVAKSADGGVAEILLENSFTNAGSSTDEITQIQGRFGGYDASYIITGKEDDFTTAELRKSYLAFSTRTATTGITEKVRIDSSGNVGIGVTPSAWTSGYSVIEGVNGQSISFAGTTPAFTSNGYVTGAGWVYKTSNYASNYYQYAGQHIWRSAASGTADAAITWSESMRIDSSGNLLVGKTSADFGVTVGAELNANDTAYFTRSGGGTLTLNRLSSDGDIALFRKDGTTVGSIGIKPSEFTVESNTTFLTFLTGGLDDGIAYRDDATARQFRPYTSKDGDIDLGADNARWKDLYLSGGVYLGGTVAANKLDDYEEGTWTPSIAGVTPVTITGCYTKIGDLCYIGGFVNFGSTSDTTPIRIDDFPFTCSSDNDARAGLVVSYSTRTTFTSILMNNSAATANLRNLGGTIPTNADFSDEVIHFGGVYKTA